MKAKKIVNDTTIEVSFDYSESCKNVYKHFDVKINSKQSNLTGLKKFITSEVPSIVTAKTYFWKPNTAANCRRRNEEKRESEVVNFFLSQNFQIL